MFSLIGSTCPSATEPGLVSGGWWCQVLSLWWTLLCSDHSTQLYGKSCKGQTTLWYMYQSIRQILWFTVGGDCRYGTMDRCYYWVLIPRILSWIIYFPLLVTRDLHCFLPVILPGWTHFSYPHQSFGEGEESLLGAFL